MIQKERIETLIDPLLEGDKLFVVSVEVNSSNHISVVLDGMKGVPIDKCVEVSRAIESGLDREEEDFSLEVTSSGIDMPLVMPVQYQKNLGQDLKVVFLDGRTLQGELTQSGDAGFQLAEEKKMKLEGKKRKELVTIHHDIKYEEIKTARVVISFKR